MKCLWTVLVLCIAAWTSPVFARELLGSSESEIMAWAQQHGYRVEDTNTGVSGCRKGKRYVQMSGAGVKIYALFYQPLYKEPSQAVTQVEFEADAPVSAAKARAWGAQVAPIVATRPPTHKQAIAAGGSGACAPPNGGFEERYTNDYLLEFQYAPGGTAVERIFVTNENIRGPVLAPPNSATP